MNNQAANRRGKPGLCVVCIDDRYRSLGVEPIGPYLGPREPREFRCTTCARSDAIPFGKIRNRTLALCEWCAYSGMYERWVQRHPDRALSREDAVRMILGQEFIVRDDSGKPLPLAVIAQRMEQVWSRIQVECIVCGGVDVRHVLMEICSANPHEGIDRCTACRTAPLWEEWDQIYRHFGLIRRHKGSAKGTQPVDATCVACGSARRVSISALVNGTAPPCLRCESDVDPNEPYFVYVVGFPYLGMRKVGITSVRARTDRIRQHLHQGGVLIDRLTVANRSEALALEKRVLDATQAFRLPLAASEMPQGGWTETWSDECPSISLKSFLGSSHRTAS